MRWISDRKWEICGRGGELVPQEGGSEVLHLTDPKVGTWGYDPRFMSVVNPRFVQDVTTNLLVPTLYARFGSQPDIQHIVLSPLEALRMVASGVRRGAITWATFESARDEGGHVVMDEISFMCNGRELVLPVRIVPELQLAHRGYLEFR